MPELNCFVPLGYNSELSWEYHDACLCDNLLFDPIFSRPLSPGGYVERLFGISVTMITMPFEIVNERNKNVEILS
jgi:hypothetical protein